MSFQWFKTHLLATGMVDRLEVANKASVKVFLKPGAAQAGGGGGGRMDIGVPHGEAGGGGEFGDLMGGGGSGAPAPGGPRPLARPLSPSSPAGVVTPLPPARGAASPDRHRYVFNIGSVDAFERKMEEAERELGWDPVGATPIT